MQYVAAPRPQLYDWKKDPGRATGISATLPPAFRALRARSFHGAPPGAAGRERPETMRKLASLGYVGGGATRPEGGPLRDPREGIRTIEAMREAGRELAAGDTEKGIARLSELVRENPEMRDAREALGSALRRAGRRQEAFEAFLDLDRRWPGTPGVMLTLAEISLELGDASRAGTFAAAADALGAPEAPPVLAAIALARRDPATARGHARRAIERNPDSRAGWMLSRARSSRAATERRGSPRSITRTGWRPLRTRLPIEDSAFLRGDALARMGRSQEARNAFLGEIGRFPSNPHGYTGLAMLEASEGRTADADRVIRQMLDRSRTPATVAAAAAAWDLMGKREEAARLRAEFPLAGDDEVCGRSSRPVVRFPEGRAASGRRHRGSPPVRRPDSCGRDCPEGPPTRMKGTGFVVWAVWGRPVTGSIICSALPWSAVIARTAPDRAAAASSRAKHASSVSIARIVSGSFPV